MPKRASEELITFFVPFRGIAVTRILPLLALLAAAAVAGCSHPLQPYDQGRAMLQRSHSLLADGDAALAANTFPEAVHLYAEADTAANSAVDCFLTTERQIEDEIQTQDAAPRSGGNPSAAQAQTVTIGSREIPAARYHADTLRAYRESLALAVILRSLAVARTAEGWYRQGAAHVAAGDQFYRARQFASAEQAYEAAANDFRAAQRNWGLAADFINSQMIAGARLAAAAPRGSWSAMKDLQVLLDRRRTQTERYLSALQERAALAARVVEAYRTRRTGNLPDLTPQALPDLPDLVRYSVTPPPVPDTVLVP
jgi:hypothetical protein